MMDVRRDNRVLSLVGKSGLRNLLTTMLDQLQRCQKSLNEFLEVSSSKTVQLKSKCARKKYYFVFYASSLKGPPGHHLATGLSALPSICLFVCLPSVIPYHLYEVQYFKFLWDYSNQT